MPQILLTVVLAIFLAIERPEEYPRASAHGSKIVKETEAALEESPELLATHRGYLAWLRAHPRQAQSETAWSELLLKTRFRPLAHAFDEALIKDAQAQVLFDQCYDGMARDGELRQGVNGLQRLEFSQQQLGDLFRNGLDFMRANPDTALRFLENPQRHKPTPEALQPFMHYFHDNPELLPELQKRMGDLMENPLFQAKVAPWWQEQKKQHPESMIAYKALQKHFMAHPNHFWVWHSRYLRLAEDAQARDWIRYWRRTVRRKPALNSRYEQYLHTLRQSPALAEASEKKWRLESGDTPAWPPKPAPPRIEGAAITHDYPTAPRLRGQISDPKQLKRPAIRQPSISRPSKPQMPSMPIMPTRPSGPTSPEKPAKPTPRTSR